MLEKKSTHIRKEEIVLATLQVIGERGAGSVTIAAIAERAGMSEANIYRHFRGKGEIFQAVAGHIGATLMARAAMIAAGSGRPLEKLRTIFLRHFDLVADNPGIPRFVFSEEVHLRDRKLAEEMAQRMASYVETIAGVIAAGTAEGDFRAGLLPRETAMTLLGMISFTAIRWSLADHSFDIRDAANRLWENFTTLVC